MAVVAESTVFDDEQVARPDDNDDVEKHKVVAAVLRSGERVLLGHRSPGRKWCPDVWDFPGGHVEGGESPQEALRRELLEEVGVDIGLVVDPPVLHLHDSASGFDLLVWVVDSWSGDVENRQIEEHDQIRWFGADELSDLAFADRSYPSLIRRLLPYRRE